MEKIPKVHIEMITEKTMDCDIQPLSSPALAAEFGRFLYYEGNENEIRTPTREIVTVCCITAKGKVLAVDCAFVGTATSSIIGMREIFMSAIMCNAAEIICYHNHPSGDPSPSVADNLMTEKIKKAGAIMDIPLRDHIILGEQGYYSYEEKGVSEWRDSRYEKAG